MTTPLVFLDLETTGLDPYEDDIWEAAWIIDDGTSVSHYTHFIAHDARKVVDMPPQFREDWARRFDQSNVLSPVDLIDALRDTIPVGAHLVGACPWFDQEFLRRLFVLHLASNQLPWHYHLIDVEALAVGYLNGAGNITTPVHPPYESDWLSNAVGVDPERFERHTAMGDAEWARAIYQAVTTDPGA